MSVEIFHNKFASGKWAPFTSVLASEQHLYPDVDSSVLFIKTDSLLGSEEDIRVKYGSQNDSESQKRTASVWISLQSTPQYRLQPCMLSSSPFQFSVPEERNKLWVLQKRGKNVVIHCNGKKVLDFTVSVTNCNDPDKDTGWKLSRYWNEKVIEVRVPSLGAHDAAANDAVTPAIDAFLIGLLVNPQII